MYQQKDIVALGDHLPGLLNIPIALLDDVLAATSEAEVLAAFAKWADRLVAADRTGIAFVDQDGCLELVAMNTETEWKIGFRFDPEHTAMGHALKNRYGQIYRDPAVVSLYDCRRMARAGMKTVICVPIVAQGRAFGAIGVAMKRNNETFARDLAILNALGRCLGTQLLVVEQISKLSEQAETDALTRAFNRHFYNDCIHRRWTRWRDKGCGFSIISLDLDHFKMVNDSYGHNVGDTVLVEVARRLMVACRKDDYVVRMGGEEFCILLDHSQEGAARAFAERIRHAISVDPVDCGHVFVPVTASLGVASVKSSDTTCDDVMGRADKAVYRAKKSGRNRVFHG